MKSKIILLAIPALLLTGLFLFLSSCDKEDPEPPIPQPIATSIALVSGGSQAANIEGTLAAPIEVIVKDQDGKAFPGHKVNFAVTEGAVSSASATTDASGKASVTWTLGSTAGEQTLTITAFKANGTTALTGSPLTVTATANAVIEATSIELVSGGDQSGDIETVLSESIKVLVKDQDGNAYPGATVNFAVAEGAVSSASETTDADGNASVTWTLGPTAGTQTLSATAFKADGTTPLSGSPLTVSATANAIPEATSIEIVTGGSQTGNIETALPNPIIVIVKDQDGNAFQGATVNFEVTEGSVSSASEISDASGNASVSWTLGATVGTQTLTVTAFKSDGITALAGSPLLVNGTAIDGNMSVTDIDGNIYQTVQIGNQIWMAENLKATHYPDGTEIPFITDNTIWGNLADNNSAAAFCYYDNDANGDYGALYTWAAAMAGAGSTTNNPSGVQGVCPSGWHLPSKAEYTELIDFLGGIYGAGGKIKETGTTHWWDPNVGATNESGFSALPGGFRSSSDGKYQSAGAYGNFWIATQVNNEKAYNLETYYNHDRATPETIPRKSSGVSVRCVKD